MKSVEEIVQEIEERLQGLNSQIGLEKELSVRDSLSGGRYELRNLLQWIKEEEEG